LVGGHCIGVDPYYLTHKAEQVGYHPQLILAGRKINDGMAQYMVKKVVQRMIKSGIDVANSTVGVMGITFKENCPDLRNTRVVDVVNGFLKNNCQVDVYDPWVNKVEANNEYGIMPIMSPLQNKYDAIVLAVAHNEFKELTIQQIRSFGKDKHILYDIKYLLDAKQVDGRL
jgi:UDP-N-acetyl-D-galactosamine dehydrogenase